MKDIELFYYYRQDVINSCYDGKRFFEADRLDKSVIALTDMIKHVRAILAECRSHYDCVEECVIVPRSRDGRKEYCAWVLGESGEVGLFFRITVPLTEAKKIQARGRPLKDHVQEKQMGLF